MRVWSLLNLLRFSLNPDGGHVSFFSKQASQRELAHVCRSLGTSLHAGIDLRKSITTAARRSSGAMHTALREIDRELQSGNDFTSAIETRSRYFPNLFADVVHIGEQTGSLPEALLALSEHYENNVKLRKEFLSQITMPIVQLLVAIFVIAGLIFLLGIIGASTGSPFDILGWGLMGASGALTWLGGWAMVIVASYVIYKLVTQSLGGRAAVHRMLLGIPVVGRCLQDFAIARFSWAFYLTQNAGMPIDDSLESSLRATSNGAFIAATDHMVREIRSGETLTDSFISSQLFPVEFIQTVDVAETSGTVPEALHRLSPQFEENARRSLKALATTASWVCWFGVAAFVIYIVISIVMWYLSQLQGALDMANGI